MHRVVLRSRLRTLAAGNPAFGSSRGCLRREFASKASISASHDVQERNRRRGAVADVSKRNLEKNIAAGGVKQAWVLWKRELSDVAKTSGSTVAGTPSSSKAEKKKKGKKQQGLAAWLWDQALHLWHGCRLLAMNARIAYKLKNQVLAGNKLTRREQFLLETTTKDLLRLLPFSLFVIIPGAELLLPVALAIFPGLIPSTFETGAQVRKNKIMRNLHNGVKRRRMFEFMVARMVMKDKLQDNPRRTQLLKAALDGSVISADDIRELAHNFDDDGPLGFNNLPKYVVSDLCQIMDVDSWLSWLERQVLPKKWHSVRLRFQVQKEFEKRLEDDKCLADTDLHSLTIQELERENDRRRMRWYGPPEVLIKQLEDWLSLSLDPDIPSHALLFIQPCASDSDVMLNFLSQEERDHILGLDKFSDTKTYRQLRAVTDAARSAEAKAKEQQKAAVEAKAKEQQKAMEQPKAPTMEQVTAAPTMAETLEEEKVETVDTTVSSDERLEISVMEEDLDDLRDHITKVSEEEQAAQEEQEALQEMGKYLSRFTDEELDAMFDTCNATDGQVNVAELEKAFRDKVAATEDDVIASGEHIKSVLDRFDFNDSGTIGREDYQSFVSRCRAGR
eukprot:TRINITY_DN11845_c0_g1_i1.p1 TRINITY_DN11845_c0_g1~~TRINITY_DN11845_c0_g1_i1.p1  ORF type:complete len:618 (+),score=197.71 TRINITY_DN11845_c0_g1_i1:110-1963(+)